MPDGAIRHQKESGPKGLGFRTDHHYRPEALELLAAPAVQQFVIFPKSTGIIYHNAAKILNLTD